MTDFFHLSTAERLDALNAAANTSGLLPHLLEKDIWVVWSLRHLFAGPYAEHLVFKGGTSLSKAYGVIRRFSEDVDLTYDIRAMLVVITIASFLWSVRWGDRDLYGIANAIDRPALRSK